MDIKPMPKPAQKKTTTASDKNAKKSANASGLKKNKKKTALKKLSKESTKENETGPSPDGEKSLEIEGVSVQCENSEEPSAPAPASAKSRISASAEEKQSTADGESVKDDASVITADCENSIRPKSSVSQSDMPQKVKNSTINRIQSTANSKKKPNEYDKRTVKSIVLVKNESLRWENALDNEMDELERIRIYKINRRKRYLAAAQAKGLGWVANYRSNGSPLSEDSGIEIQGRESNSYNDNIAGYGTSTIKSLGPSQLPGIKPSAMVDC